MPQLAIRSLYTITIYLFFILFYKNLIISFEQIFQSETQNKIILRLVILNIDNIEGSYSQ